MHEEDLTFNTDTPAKSLPSTPIGGGSPEPAPDPVSSTGQALIRGFSGFMDSRLRGNDPVGTS